MIVWVNLHGSFMLGLLLPLVFLVEAAFEAGPRWRQAAADWAVFILAAWACALLNPDGVSGLLFPFRLLGMADLDWIGEWQPADFAAFRPLELTILVLLGVGLMGRLRVPPLRLLMLLGLVHMALRHWRHDQLLGLLGPLLLAEAIGRMTPAPEATSTDPSAGETVPALRAVTPLRRAAPPVGMALLTAIAVIARLAMPLDHEPGAGVLAALDTVPAALRAKPVLNDYGFGAGLIAHGDHRSSTAGRICMAAPFWAGSGTSRNSTRARWTRRCATSTSPGRFFRLTRRCFQSWTGGPAGMVC